VTTTIGLNGRQWPNALTIAKSGSSNLLDTNYTYDPVGNVTSISNTGDSSFNRTMGYDFLDRVIIANGPWGSGTIAYDAQSNIVGQSLGNSNINYNYDTSSGTPTRRLTSTSGSKAYAIQYDVYGNVINNGFTNFNYNDAANLKCAKCGQTGQVLYEYDGNNQRVKSSANGETTYFVYGQGGQLLWEETPNSLPNGIRKEYIYLGGKQIATREEILP
jgi:hypothetical protein